MSRCPYPSGPHCGPARTLGRWVPSPPDGQALSERPGPLRPPDRSGMHVNLEKVTGHAGPVLRGRAWAHEGRHAFVCVPDKGLQWRQSCTRDSFLLATLLRCGSLDAGLQKSGEQELWVRSTGPLCALAGGLSNLRRVAGADPRCPPLFLSAQEPGASHPRLQSAVAGTPARSASRGQEVVWQGGGPVCRGHDQGWREHGCSREPPRKGKASHVYQKTPEDLTHRHQPLLDNSPRSGSGAKQEFVHAADFPVVFLKGSDGVGKSDFWSFSHVQVHPGN